mmetsp:Transcript_1877/g.11274  ORF Transcript_1877/g.11274 Transcript_1877/m.11274 type:complete len:81 (+) Transcript_1877:2322-2564(+)
MLTYFAVAYSDDVKCVTAKVSDLGQCAAFLGSLLFSSITYVSLHVLSLSYCIPPIKYKHSAELDMRWRGDPLSWVYHTWL